MPDVARRILKKIEFWQQKWQILKKRIRLFSCPWHTHNFLQKFQPIWSSCLASYSQQIFLHFYFKILNFLQYSSNIYMISDENILTFLYFLFLIFFLFEHFWKKKFWISLHYATLQERTIFRVFFWAKLVCFPFF